MTTYQRPWWVIAMQLPALETTLKEDHQAKHTQFTLNGKPIVRNFAWVTYGPLFAVLGVVLMGIVAWAIDISDQAGGSRIGFACGMFLVPALLWLIGGFSADKFMRLFLKREVEAKQVQVQIKLDAQAKTLQVDSETPLAFANIQDFKLVADSGFEYEPAKDSNPLVHLMAETTQGQVKLLQKDLGTAQQKQQLISKLRAIIDADDG